MSHLVRWDMEYDDTNDPVEMAARTLAFLKTSPEFTCIVEMEDGARCKVSTDDGGETWEVDEFPRRR